MGEELILREKIGMNKPLYFQIITFEGLKDAQENAMSILQKMTFDQSNPLGK